MRYGLVLLKTCAVAICVSAPLAPSFALDEPLVVAQSDQIDKALKQLLKKQRQQQQREAKRKRQLEAKQKQSDRLRAAQQKQADRLRAQQQSDRLQAQPPGDQLQAQTSDRREATVARFTEAIMKEFEARLRRDLASVD